MLFAFTKKKIIQTPSHVLLFCYIVFCHVFSKKEHNPNGSCGGVALVVCVGGKFSDWFKILKALNQ